MIPMARVNSTGFEEADPASRNDMFINAPKNAAKPVSSPTISPIPTASSPSVISQPNQLYAPLSSRVWMNVRYQSNVMAGLPAPWAGIATACSQ